MGNRFDRPRNDRGDNRSERYDSGQTDNRRVTHIYDSRAKGTLARNNRDETLVGVIWDDRPGVLHPCIREELTFERDASQDDRRPRGRNDRDNRGRGSDRGGFRRNRDDDESFVAGA